MMFRAWKSVPFGVACAVSVVPTIDVLAECPCKKANIYQISQVAPPPAGPLTPIPMPNGFNPIPMPQAQPGLPPAPQPSVTSPSVPGYQVVPGVPNVAPPAPAPQIQNPPPPAPVSSALSPTLNPNSVPAPLNPPLTPTPISGDYPPVAPHAGTLNRPGTDRFGMSPPPGTLGRTYQQRSRIFDDEKHPRAAAVDVYLPEDIDVSARGMKSVWTGKLWRLEAKDPLLPGVPHIYAIKAERKTKEGEVTSTDVRWIRLIPGRVVDLQF